MLLMVLVTFKTTLTPGNRDYIILHQDRVKRLNGSRQWLHHYILEKYYAFRIMTLQCKSATGNKPARMPFGRNKTIRLRPICDHNIIYLDDNMVTLNMNIFCK